MMPALNDATVAKLCKWREQCRLNLLDLEKKSIFVRVCAVEKIINEKTYEINRILCLNVEDTCITPYKHYIDADQQCKFIQNWNGLNTNQMRSVPNSFQDYETRAKNWLNGRRAINYAQSLFPELMLCAEDYAQSVAVKLYPQNDDKRCLYRELLLYSYLSGICSGRVALRDGHHRASLICENSIKKEGNLKRTLQKYFRADNGECTSFPKHLQDAIDYFKDKYHEKLNQFQSQYTRAPTQPKASAIHYSNARNAINTQPIHYPNTTERQRYPFSQRNECNYDPYRPHRTQSGSVMEVRNHPYAASPPHEWVNKLNCMRRRNSFLEQQLVHYREQQRLDHQRIQLLETQLSFDETIEMRPPLFNYGNYAYDTGSNNNYNNSDTNDTWNMDISEAMHHNMHNMQSPFPINIPLPSHSIDDSYM